MLWKTTSQCVAAALVALAAAGAGHALPAPAKALPVADAKHERPIPCVVAAHGMGAILDEMEGAKPASACDHSLDPATIDLDRFERVISDQHPALYYIFASRLFDSGRKDEALFWFYAGQLRYRIRLGCHPDLPQDSEPALFGALQATVGEKINSHARRRPASWISTLERVFEWDARTANGFEPRASCQAAIAEQRKGLVKLTDYVRKHRSELGR
ncbi:MAG TPA: hypothetical protein VF650_07130 [Allosphingosinicella sp.]|jgi:hypothetical protein